MYNRITYLENMYRRRTEFYLIKWNAYKECSNRKKEYMFEYKCIDKFNAATENVLDFLILK